jgi:membrane protein implicated in regulation of membrane protease activity
MIMQFEIWWVWMALAALFIVGEIFTQGFFLFWFGIGAAAAGVLALLGLSFGWQLGAFVVISGVLFIASRRFAERFSKKQPPGIGADRFVGLEGIVLEEIDNAKNTGRVRVEKDEWRADSEIGDLIPEGKRIIVSRLDGAHMVVRLKKEEE